MVPLCILSYLNRRRSTTIIIASKFIIRTSIFYSNICRIIYNTISNLKNTNLLISSTKPGYNAYSKSVIPNSCNLTVKIERYAVIAAVPYGKFTTVRT